jgi:hypothetical protein
MYKTSTYSKIRAVLDAAALQKGNVSSLAKSIYGKSDAFVYFKRDRDGDVRAHPCDESSIRKKIRFCIRLGLLESEENCALTADGKTALKKGRFDLQLQTAVNTFLQTKGLPIAKINKAIDKLVLPHTESLYQYLAPDLSEPIFRTCLFLLSTCGEDNNQNVLKSFSNKLYLTDAKIEKARKSMEKN